MSTRDRLTALLMPRENWHPDDLADAVDAILAEFLVVPRSEIVGTEYGWRSGPDANVRDAPTRDQAIRQAARARAAGGVWSNSEAVEHVIAWSVIPLPEDGE